MLNNLVALTEKDVSLLIKSIAEKKTKRTKYTFIEGHFSDSSGEISLTQDEMDTLDYFQCIAALPIDAQQKCFGYVCDTQLFNSGTIGCIVFGFAPHLVSKGLLEILTEGGNSSYILTEKAQKGTYHANIFVRERKRKD